MKLHIGNKCDNSDKLFVHKNTMNESHEVKYLGYLIHQNGRPKSTITERVIRGYAICGQIFALLKEIQIGNLRVSIGLELRQARLLNVILYNSEV